MTVSELTHLNNISAEEAYAEVMEKIKELEALKDSLNQEIIQKMSDNGMTNIETEKGQFILAWKKKWEYSNETQHLEVRWKEAKIREQNNGTALRMEDTCYLRYLSSSKQTE